MEIEAKKIIEEIKYIAANSTYESDLAKKTLDVMSKHKFIIAYVPDNGFGKSEMVLYFINKYNQIKHFYYVEGTALYNALPVEIELSDIQFIGEDENLVNLIDRYRILYNLKNKYKGEKMDKRFLEMLENTKKKLKEEAKKEKKEREEEIREIQKMLDEGIPCRKVIESITNQYGEPIASEYVYIDKDEMKCYYVRLLCHSSHDLGLGTCRCISHPTWDSEEISPAEYLSFF